MIDLVSDDSKVVEPAKRFTVPPRNLSKVDPRKILVSIPTHDGRIWAGCAGGISQCVAAQRFGNFYFHAGGSCINHVRNQMASIFLKSQSEILICIDSDIEFTVQDFDFLMSGPEMIGTALYLKKVERYLPVTYGMGFVRIDRQVFEILDQLVDDTGRPMVAEYYENGHIEKDYFRTGASSDARWMAEDFGFWSLVQLAGITPQIEKRTRLKHWGMKSFNYVGDVEQGSAQ